MLRVAELVRSGRAFSTKVYRTICLKLEANPEQRLILKRTMKLYDEAFNISAAWGYQNRCSNKIENHKATYRIIRDTIPDLPSYLVEGARDLACTLLERLQLGKIPRRKPFSSILFHSKAAGVYLWSGFTNLITVSGRIKIPFKLGQYFFKYVDWKVRSSTLTYKHGLRAFFLCVTVESNPFFDDAKGPVLGIDRGVNNVAVTSANQFFSSKVINNVRGKYQHLRAELQSKGTRSAHRKLRRMSGRERRFKADMNHRIAKEIVNAPYGVFVLEDLKGINFKKKQRSRGSNWARASNRRLSNWNYHQLEKYIRYKAEELGKTVISVNGKNTSKKCSACGHKSTKNRCGKSFRCTKCGFQLHADLNASRNIAQLGISELSRLSVNQPNVALDEISMKSERGRLQAHRWSG